MKEYFRVGRVRPSYARKYVYDQGEGSLIHELCMFGNFAIGHSLLAIGRNPHSAEWLGRNKKHVRISRQSAMSGPLPALCGANATVARPPVGIDCADGQIHAHSRDFANGPNGTLVLKTKHRGIPYDSGMAPAGEIVEIRRPNMDIPNETENKRTIIV